MIPGWPCIPHIAEDDPEASDPPASSTEGWDCRHDHATERWVPDILT